MVISWTVCDLCHRKGKNQVATEEASIGNMSADLCKEHADKLHAILFGADSAESANEVEAPEVGKELPSE